MSERTAGRELDALVAEKVMGLTIVALDWPCGYDPECGNYEASSFLPPIGGWYGHADAVYAPDERGWPPEAPARDRVEQIKQIAGDATDDETLAWVKAEIERQYALVEPVPPYSTSIEAAWQVVERLVDDGWAVDVRHSTAWSHFPEYRWDCSLAVGAEMPRRELGPTAPLAICLAALKAKEPRP